MKSKALGIATLLLAYLLVSGNSSATAQDTDDRSTTGHPFSQPQDTQDFQDVPTSYLFYGVIHNLYTDHVIGGFPCGGPGEPCVPPGNLPYFRPTAPVTRAQNAKFTDNGRRIITGIYTGTSPYFGIFSAINTDQSAETNAGIYGQGAVGIWGESVTTGTIRGNAGFFANFGGSTGDQYGIYDVTAAGVGLYASSSGAISDLASAGVVGRSTVDAGAGGVFTGTTTPGGGSAGIVASARTGGVLSGANATASPQGDGLDVAANASVANYAIFAQQPVGDIYYSLYGVAHIHGTNISGADYESEVVYDGYAPLTIGSVVALDPNNQMGGPLGVVGADGSDPEAAIGIISYRLGTMKEGNVDKTIIDATASSVSKGDRAYITILGRVKMKLGDSAKVGSRLTLDASGAVTVAGKDTLASFGKVASQPNKDGYAYVLVNFK